MSRQEDFIEAGIAYRMKHGKPMCIAGSNLVDVERDFNRVLPFEAGCEHGYQYAVGKACEWLRAHLGAPKGIPQAKAYEDAMNELISEFRKEMEE